MANEQAIKVLLDEWKCIDRNDGINCDRQCEKCDLVMDSAILKDAYNTAIQALEKANIYDDGEHYVTISKALYDRLNVDTCTDTVSHGVFEQVMRERDIAIEQLHELGYELGQKIEPCEDAISRSDMLDAVGHGTTYTSEEVQKIVNNLSPVTPQQKYGEWIPVSERLPEVFSFVNCTCHSLIDDREDWVVETCYLPQLPDSPYSDWGNIPMLNNGDCEVVAWMYRDIPKPYKVEPQESEDKE